jgi:hypothetical protein
MYSIGGYTLRFGSNNHGAQKPKFYGTYFWTQYWRQVWRSICQTNGRFELGSKTKETPKKKSDPIGQEKIIWTLGVNTRVGVQGIKERDEVALMWHHFPKHRLVLSEDYWAWRKWCHISTTLFSHTIEPIINSLGQTESQKYTFGQ